MRVAKTIQPEAPVPREGRLLARRARFSLGALLTAWSVTALTACGGGSGDGGGDTYDPPVDPYYLTLRLTGNGSVNIDGHMDCTQPVCDLRIGPPLTYGDDLYVYLTANPTPGYAFAGWGGDCASGGTWPTMTLKMDGDRSCTATFTR